MSDFADLEAELKRLQPRAVSPELSSRIETALAQEVAATPTAGILPRTPKARFSWFALWFGTAAAAALVTIAVFGLERDLEPQQTRIANGATPATRRIETPAATALQTRNSSFVPDGLTRVVYHRRDEGLVYSRKTESPARRVHSRARETLQWKEPGTGASLRVSYPTEEVELIPVSGQ